MSRTDAILERLLALYPKAMDLQLERELRLLEELGRPQDRLPPVIHVAGTNGKGSTIAYLRAFLEAAGKRVHTYISPHLVRFNERIRLAGTLVTDEALNAALEHCETVNAGKPITYFEITTCAAFMLFTETPADYLLMEVGMGGEFDSTNVIDHPLGAVVTPVAIDHVKFLGNTVGQIALAKAGILKRGSPAIFGRQEEDGLKTLTTRARFLRITPFIAGQDFDGFAQNGRMVYQDDRGLLDLPLPKLLGAHQIDNATLAVATTRHLNLPVSEADIATGLGTVDWPARLTPLKGRLRDMLGRNHELWLDGGHNAHGVAALARAIEEMNKVRPAPLVLILGMMNTRDAGALLDQFNGHIAKVLTLTIPGEQNAHDAQHLAEAARSVGLEAAAKETLTDALHDAAQVDNARVMIAGSLYLAGHVLAENGTPPN